jgi:hypothetical protein
MAAFKRAYTADVLKKLDVIYMAVDTNEMQKISLSSEAFVKLDVVIGT